MVVTVNKPFVIAIDGPAASGKGSLAKRLAKHLDFDFLDTGALYRRIALYILEQGLDLKNTDKITKAAKEFKPQLSKPYDDSNLRTDEVGNTASLIAQIPEIRQILLNFQQGFAKNSKNGAVLDGRDIATVICPDANLKLFITASTEKRAERRHKELHSRGLDVKYEAVLVEMQERDNRDSVRLDDHMKLDIDNHLIDTSDMGPDEVFQTALNFYNSSSR